MRRIKQGKCDYDYVELMACPSGCTNGGGQVKVSQLGAMEGEGMSGGIKENKDLVKAVNEILHKNISTHSSENNQCDLRNDKKKQQFYSDLLAEMQIL